MDLGPAHKPQLFNHWPLNTSVQFGIPLGIAAKIKGDRKVEATGLCEM